MAVTIHDLPPEIIRMICESFVDESEILTNETGPFEDDHLKNLRLASRVFLVDVTAVLFRNLVVFPNTDSLAKLEKISKEPHLSQLVTYIHFFGARMSHSVNADEATFDRWFLGIENFSSSQLLFERQKSSTSSGTGVDCFAKWHEQGKT